LRHFGGSAECLPVDGVAAVLDELARRQSEFGLIPLGNSVESRVAADFDAVVRGEMKLCGIVRLALHYAVLGKCSRGEVREVYGEPAALPRCRSWLAVHLPTARTVEVTSASTACRLADEKPGAAAVAAREWAAPCKLDVLADKIETHPAGSACFAVIGEQIPPRTKNDCTAILLQVDNRPGGLADALGVLKRNKVNLSRIESLPAENCDKHAIFFVEIAGHAADKRLGRKLESLRRKTTRLEILGSYPTPGPVD
ncbi:MAG: ACT domain-containing protein, partial [Pirellulaceae bacterium]|nr:ACT domain-containing protein [Pirellulaceae bacterium]